MADNLTSEQRRRCMQRNPSKNTRLEARIFECLDCRRFPYLRHVSSLPGRPDVVFPEAGLAVFIDGDFWHGWRYPAWSQTLPSAFWREKIEKNRRRDQRNFRKLRRLGWKVLRLWEHQIKSDVDSCVERILHIRRERLKKGTRATLLTSAH